MSASQILSSLEPEQRRILLNPAVTPVTKSALLVGLHVTPAHTVALLDYLGSGAAHTPHTTAAVPGPAVPPTPDPGLEYNDTSMKRVAALLAPSLSGGGRVPSEHEVNAMEKEMASLLHNLSYGSNDGKRLTGGGDPMDVHATIMRQVLDPDQYTTWSQGGKVHGVKGGQRQMIVELSRGALLSNILTPHQIRDMAFGRTPHTTKKQRYVAQTLFTTRAEPLMVWGAQMMYPPSHDVN